jgi:hypothetical protein
MKKKWLFLTIAIVSLTACSNDDEVQQNGLHEIRFYTDVVHSTRAADVAADLQNTQLAANTSISVQITDNNPDVSQQVVYNLATYIANGSGKLNISPDEPKQYFPTSGSTVDIYAYHPAGAAETFSVSTDQSLTAGYVASDLMWASLSGIDKNSTAEECKLHLAHKLSKIVVQLVKGTQVTDEEINAASISIGPVVYKGTFTASTGTFVTAEDVDANKSTITIATDAGTSAHAAIIVPQEVTGKRLSVTMGSSTQSYIFPETTTFASGKKYTYTVTVKKGGITVVTSVTDWSTDVSVNPQPIITF